ncbi:uncharacterized protein PHA67_023416 [Liasis olivaceus]
MKPLLEKLAIAVCLPTQLAIVHCRGHQTDRGEISRGNHAADYWAKQAARGGDVMPAETHQLLPLIPVGPDHPLPPLYDQRDNLDPQGKWKDGWWIIDNRVQLPLQILWMWLSQRYSNKKLRHLCQSAVAQCAICHRNNPKSGKPTPPGCLRTAQYPGEAWQVDFTELPKKGPKNHLLVFVDLFSGWPEAFPVSSQRAGEVVRALVEYIIPRFSVPKGLESDNGRHFTSDVTQQVSKFLDIPWYLHSSYRPQASAKVEHMNHSLKTQLAKLCQETQLPWPKILPLALTRIRAVPRGPLLLPPL